jgi:ribonuclease P protein component
MLKKQYRLTKDKEFDKVFRNGRSSYDKVLGIKALNNGMDYCRFGIMVSAKVSKKAVERNTIRRRLNETLRNKMPLFKIRADVVIIVLPAARDKTSKLLADSLTYNLSKLKVI